ncbi:MAG TPA: SLBB domain-containing protein [Terracidiphilus sp.]|nr:SLBB domain-containing protein [Terracidiphilus sp.]
MKCDGSAPNPVPDIERRFRACRAAAARALAVFVIALTILIAGHAQQLPGSTQSNQTVTGYPADCSDPLLASTAQCGSTTEPYGAMQGIPSQSMQNPLLGAGAARPGEYYSDTESLTRNPAAARQSPQPILPPEKLTEFQKFTASTTGQILPIFGASLFRQVPSTFSPLEMSPVPPDYVIGPDDQLRIRVWGQVSFQANVRVDRSGDVYLPQVGEVHVAGLTSSQLDDHLRAAVGRVYRNFNLTADLGQIRAIQVYVTGEARRPGVYTISSLSTLVDALFASGGPSVNGSLRHILLKRGSEVVTDFDLYDLLARGDKSKDAKLLSGDVIFIPPSGPQVALTGSVRNPAIYELRANETLAGLLKDAGGVSAVASGARVSIERIVDHDNRQAMEVAYDATGLATTLDDGDLIRVFPIVPKYSKTVTLRGNTANPGRFAWHPGMRLSDLIPDKESLITRNYWWKRVQLGLPAPEFESSDFFAYRRQPVENQPVHVRFPQAAQNGANQADQSGANQNDTGAQPTDQANPQQPQSGAGQAGQPGSSQTSNVSAQQRAGSSSIAAGEVLASPQMPPPAQKTEVNLIAPDIDWNYAVIERQDQSDLKTTLIPFDLGKLVLEHDASQNLELQPGDVVSVFSAADIRVPIAQQTKMVRLEGEFLHAGVYTAKPGETLRELVERAGGITSNAYLYGSEFTRESTRAVQQARIDEYVQNLAARIQRSNLALASGVNNASQEQTIGAAQAAEAQLIARLRQMRATGRIVFNLKQDSHGIDSLPDIALENGDRFIVPHVPATVNVVGAVYDQNAFLYQSRGTVEDYLRLAGGPNKDADRKHEFIIRADGEVISHEMERGLWGNDFKSLKVNPGDTIVVPEKTFKPSVLKGVLDWSQVFSQLALGAAAINVLH